MTVTYWMYEISVATKDENQDININILHYIIKSLPDSYDQIK